MGSKLSPHAVHRLYQYRKSLSTKEFGARGKNLKRCELCLLGQQYCTCEFRSQLNTNSAFLLLMYDDEVLKPTNSGRLIADLVPDTWAYLWSRTEVNDEVLALLADPQFMPFVVFPGEYAEPHQTVCSEVTAEMLGSKRPLFVMLDGRWREAIKMFRKSPYLANLPLLSFDAGTLARYALRKGTRDFQFGTAEVASMVLGAMGEADNGASLATWFDLFIESSLLGRNRRPNTTLAERERLIALFQAQQAGDNGA
ncbi:DTW domain-containing protein [Shewanella sp. JM162201]|uniref:tRNA-uridine aminocarboxypropyltransferase n=1 Tax=Shewanella jiangmenensis TaxID=2837387 RepID=A0ABS5V4T6_9GAMM|nr:tRNA-uridine aminocarboxypropyltransferase [Shewanella jiangmenensis]MBT1445480.1 DTW domain-containing protein [Shewanella jiangmenensis]